MDKSLKVVAQKEVSFYGDELTAVQVDDGQVYVSVRHMCNALGIQRPQRQTDRIKRDEVLSDGLQRVPIMGTRGRQRAYVLRVDLVPLWLAGVEASRVGDEVRDKIIRYKREAAKVLWEAFQEGRLTADPSFEELLESDSPAVNAYKTALAIVELARNQILIEARLDDYEERLERIEATLGDTGRNITSDQASQLSQAVKAVAHAMGGHSKHYQGVYGELYRREGITSYKLLPAHRFESVMQWLANWYRDLTDGVKVPF